MSTSEKSNTEIMVIIASALEPYIILAYIIFQAADLINGKSDAYTRLAEGQMDYIIGNNPKKQR